jgi:hypothetical protein
LISEYSSFFFSFAERANTLSHFLHEQIGNDSIAET